MNRTLCFVFIYLVSFWACRESSTTFTTDDYQSPIIPAISKLSSDEGFSKSRQGVLLLDSLPYSGMVISLDPEQNILEKTSYHNGLIEGNMLGFYPSGERRFERPYRKGKKHGEHFGWYEGGNLKFHYLFEKGLSEGNHKEWYEDGSLFKDLNYANGRPLGAQQVWRRDGKIRANYVIRENGKRYGLMGIKRCTKLDTEKEEFDPYIGNE